MNHEVANRGVVFTVAERACGAYQSRTFDGKAHDRAVLEGPFDLVTLTSAQVADATIVKLVASLMMVALFGAPCWRHRWA
jgi:hypothetical protein